MPKLSVKFLRVVTALAPPPPLGENIDRWIISEISDHETMFTKSSLRPLRRHPHHVEYININGQTAMGLGRNLENLSETSARRHQNLTFRLSGHPSSRLPYNTSLTRQYVVTRSQSHGLLELSGPFIVNGTNYSRNGGLPEEPKILKTTKR